MRFDGPTFARAWLAVAQAAGNDQEVWHQYRAVTIEEYADGVRLVSSDGYMLLVAWVPDLAHTEDEDPGDAPEPELDEMPSYVTIVRDVDHRGQSLLKYAMKLLSTFDKDIRNRVGLVKLDLHFDVERPEPTETDDVALDGMERRYAALELPDAERVYLEKIDGSTTPPDWRRILEKHTRTPASDLRLSPERLARIAIVANYARGVIEWSLAGDTGLIVVSIDSPRPIVGGGIYPLRELVDQTPTEACNACDNPDTLCMRHASGLVTAASRLGSSLRPGESLTIEGGGHSTTIDGPAEEDGPAP